jgi:hypothetical protein
MTTYEIARICDARQIAKGWVARCPAHADRSPSLSIREGRGGRTLVRCFAGCEPSSITAALGLRLSDLFSDQSSRERTFSTRPACPTADDVERALRDELSRILEREAVHTGFATVAELRRHRNEARSVIERRYSVSLKHEAPHWTEVEPHCVDPAWKACVDQALNVAAASRGVKIETLRASLGDLPKTQNRVLAYARKLQCNLAKESAASRPCAP